ncbi:Osmolarity sensor protein EnvZ [Raoultella terrigena]|uniref:Sensor histidine kinase EnvZ n=1 Tax=Raoultella terrigena TaxID=577 RepID=A0A3P8JKE3_RAOTE|nr:Osmolarity sensor protein EnvZ [Raoultella terrigena]
MQQRLARHLEGKTRMLASMSHDFNTPLTELRLQIELMEAGEARDDMLESLIELQSMVSETLNFIRDETPQEKTCRCDLSKLLSDLTHRYGQKGESVTWQGEAGITINCRPLAIKRVLSNLIENALSYAGEASVRLTAESNMVRIDVLDSGPGIPEKQLEQVFEPFVRLNDHRAARRHFGGGLGLGLSIARACVHAHGGELSLKNRSPAGLCATILLPGAIRS